MYQVINGKHCDIHLSGQDVSIFLGSDTEFVPTRAGIVTTDYMAYRISPTITIYIKT